MRGLVSAVLAIGLMAASVLNTQVLFGTYRKSVGHHYNTQTNVRALAEYLDASGTKEGVAVIGLYLYDRAVIEFLAPDAAPVYADNPKQT